MRSFPIFFIAAVLLAPRALHAQSDPGRAEVLKAALRHAVGGGAIGGDQRGQVTIDRVTARACAERECYWFSNAQVLSDALRSFIVDSLGAQMRDRDAAMICDDDTPHFCKFDKSRALVRLSEPVIRADTAWVGVNWYRDTRQPYAMTGEVERFIRRAGAWVFDKITFEWM